MADVDGAVGMHRHPVRHDQRADPERGVEAAGDPHDHHVVGRTVGRHRLLEHASGGLAGPLGTDARRHRVDDPSPDRALVRTLRVVLGPP